MPIQLYNYTNTQNFQLQKSVHPSNYYSRHDITEILLKVADRHDITKILLKVADRHDITDILLKVALNTTLLTLIFKYLQKEKLSLFLTLISENKTRNNYWKYL